MSKKDDKISEWVEQFVANPAVRLAIATRDYHSGRMLVDRLIAAAPPHARPKYLPARRQLVYPNGAVVCFYSGRDELRGTEHHAACLLGVRRVDPIAQGTLFSLRREREPKVLFTEDACS